MLLMLATSVQKVGTFQGGCKLSNGGVDMVVTLLKAGTQPVDENLLKVTMDNKNTSVPL